MTDPIADMLTRIRNALLVNKASVLIPQSKIKLEILKVMEKHGYIVGYEVVEQGKFPEIKVKLKYDQDNQSHIKSMKRISKVGRRVYCSAAEMPVVLNNLGIAIVTTPKGVMTNKEAKKQKVGGEVLCEIY